MIYDNPFVAKKKRGNWASKHLVIFSFSKAESKREGAGDGASIFVCGFLFVYWGGTGSSLLCTASSSCHEEGCSLAVLHRLVSVAEAPLVGSTGHLGSGAPGLRSCSTRAQWPLGKWDLPGPGWNPCPLNWQAASQPFDHQGSPEHLFKLGSSQR